MASTYLPVGCLIYVLTVVMLMNDDAKTFVVILRFYFITCPWLEHLK